MDIGKGIIFRVVAQPEVSSDEKKTYFMIISNETTEQDKTGKLSDNSLVSLFVPNDQGKYSIEQEMVFFKKDITKSDKKIVFDGKIIIHKDNNSEYDKIEQKLNEYKLI